MSLAQPGQAGQFTRQSSNISLGRASTTPPPPHLSLGWACQVGNRPVSKPSLFTVMDMHEAVG